jgi:hypothetical protein
MVGAVLRAGACPAVAGLTGVAVVAGGCGAAFPAAATVLFPICFALLAAAAAFTLDEPASLVVDVTPTGPVRRTSIRAVALLAPLAAGALVMLAAAMRGLALPWAAAGLALAGNVLLGFAPPRSTGADWRRRQLLSFLRRDRTVIFLSLYILSCSGELCRVRVIPAVDVAVVQVKAARRCDGWAGWPVGLWIYGGSTRGVPTLRDRNWIGVASGWARACA